MDDYIKRENVLNRLKLVDMKGTLFFAGVQTGIDHAIRCIQEEPAADVVEVRHGEWEPGNPICPVCGKNKFDGLDADIWSDWMPNFCPSCGARMDKEENQ